MVGLQYESNQGGAVALLQRLHSFIDEQMAEALQFVAVSDVPEEKESLDGTSSHATSCISHEGRLTLEKHKSETNSSIMKLSFPLNIYICFYFSFSWH